MAALRDLGLRIREELVERRRALERVRVWLGTCSEVDAHDDDVELRVLDVRLLPSAVAVEVDDEIVAASLGHEPRRDEQLRAASDPRAIPRRGLDLLRCLDLGGAWRSLCLARGPRWRRYRLVARARIERDEERREARDVRGPECGSLDRAECNIPMAEESMGGRAHRTFPVCFQQSAGL